MKNYLLLGKEIRIIFFICGALLVLNSCGIQQNLLFQTPTSINPDVFNNSVLAAEGNYIIQKGDYLAVSIFPNKGEQIIDQTQDFPIGENSGAAGGQGTNAQQMQNTNVDNGNTQFNLPIRQNNDHPSSYLVNENGIINLPQIGAVKVDSLTLHAASELLTKKYATYIKNPYVIMQYLNKRAIVMGALGEHVVALRNENMSLYEVISLASGGAQTGGESVSIQKSVKTRNIRIIRNYKTSPSVLVVDLTTIEGVEKLNTNIQPNDIIYLEPRRKFDREPVSDIGAILSPIASIIALIVAINALK